MDVELFKEKYVDRHTSIVVPQPSEVGSVYVDPFPILKRVFLCLNIE